MKHFTYRLALLLTFIATGNIFASQSWQLDATQSTIHFISIKKDTIAETHSFKQFSGEVNSSGEATVAIDLASVETMIPIRNERMNEFLFETVKFPKATIQTTIQPSMIHALKPGEKKVLPLSLQVNFHGKEQTIDGKFTVIKLNDKTISVNSVSPLIVNARAFELVAGVNKLKELAGLPSISEAVPVTTQLVFVAK